jgi:predicted GTPase
MLLINPEAEYLLFDLNCHKYTEPAFNYIKSQFPSTKINIIFGDSTKTMHKFIVDNQTELHSYDLIHIDGGHTIDIFSHDYNNSKQLSVNNGVVVFDDYDYDRIYTFIQKMIAQKEIIEYTDSNIIRTRLHFVYTYL